MSRISIAIAAAIGIACLAPPAGAGPSDRPTKPQAPILNADLSEPWLVQVKPVRRSAAAAYPVTSRGTYSDPRQNAAVSRSQPAPAGRKPVNELRRRTIDPRFLPRLVAYRGNEAPGTIVIDTEARFLYLVLGDGKAQRYGVGVGRPGFEWAGTHKVTRRAEWPDWTPPEEMLQRRPDLPRHMEGGPDNPLGARALYLGSTLYRIHGSNEPWTIGHAVSSGCIRMRNEDVIDLYDRVKVGTPVVVI
jgi:lipoprotein-anchoring transpeptidase ErfK/SrfK